MRLTELTLSDTTGLSPPDLLCRPQYKTWNRKAVRGLRERGMAFAQATKPSRVRAG